MKANPNETKLNASQIKNTGRTIMQFNKLFKFSGVIEYNRNIRILDKIAACGGTLRNQSPKSFK